MEQSVEEVSSHATQSVAGNGFLRAKTKGDTKVQTKMLIPGRKKMSRGHYDEHDKKHFECALQCFKKATGTTVPTDEWAKEFYEQEESLNYRLGITDGRVLHAFVLLILSARLASQGVDGFRPAGTLAARASELLLAADKQARKEGNLRG